MSHRALYIVVIACCVLAVRPGPAASEAGAPGQGDLVQIHLPREVTVRDSLLSLGQVTVIRGAGPVATTAGAVGLGRLSVPGQKIVLDRATILSRLASCGISAENVRLTGAEAVTVRRDQRIITGDDFVAVAQLFLRQSPSLAAVHESTATVRPRELVLPGGAEDVQVTPRFVRNGVHGFVTVQIAVAVDGRQIGSRDIPFRLRYRCHKVVALQQIAEGEALTPGNVRVEETVSDSPEPTGWRPPYGLLAVRAVPANTEIRPDMVDSGQPPLVIRRNETVVIRIQRPGFLVTAVGLALQEARPGEYVKVRNSDSHRVIVCKVNPDGTVEPVL